MSISIVRVPKARLVTTVLISRKVRQSAQWDSRASKRSMMRYLNVKRRSVKVDVKTSLSSYWRVDRKRKRQGSKRHSKVEYTRIKLVICQKARQAHH